MGVTERDCGASAGAARPEEKGEDGQERDSELCARSELERLRERLGELEDLHLRARADLENYRRRAEKDRLERERFACEALVRDLLPIMDNFHCGLQSAAGGAPGQELLSGFSLVFNQLQALLQSRGVRGIGAVGGAFDPHAMEAVAQVAHDSIPEQHIVEVKRPGQQLEGRLLRPALVVVSMGKASAPSPAEPTLQDAADAAGMN
jgi:molecular chaperone GrpE